MRSRAEEEEGGVRRYGEAIVRSERRAIGRVGDEVPEEGTGERERVAGVEVGVGVEVGMGRMGVDGRYREADITEREVEKERAYVKESLSEEGIRPNDLLLKSIERKQW